MYVCNAWDDRYYKKKEKEKKGRQSSKGIKIKIVIRKIEPHAKDTEKEACHEP